jgi:beta-lactamase regulating signal transducer with metallopeptidase domain
MKRNWNDYLFVFFSVGALLSLFCLALYFLFRSVVKLMYFSVQQFDSWLWFISFLIVFVVFVGLLKFGKHIWDEYRATRLHSDMLDLKASYDEKSGIHWSPVLHQEAYTFGLFSPQILISNGVKQALTDKELKAVIAHERFHQRHFHPLAFWCIEAIVQLFWFIPFIRCVKDFFEYIAEVWADRSSVQSVSVKSVASAFLKMVVAWQQPVAACSIVGFAASSERIEHLLNQKRCLWCRFPIWCFLSGVFSLSLLALFFHFCTVELVDIFT